MATRTANTVSVKNTVSQKSVLSTANNAQIKGKQNVKSSPSQISTASNASQLNGQKPMFNNMTKSAVSRPFIEKRSGLQDIDTGTFYQMYYGNRNLASYPQISNPMNSQQIQQNNLQMQPQMQQQNADSQHLLHNQQQINQNQINRINQLPQQQIPPQMLQQMASTNQQILQQVPQQQQGPLQQIPQEVPQQIPLQQMPQQGSCLQLSQATSVPQQLDGQDNHPHYGHDNFSDQKLQEQCKQQQQQQQQIPMQYQLNNQQIGQLPETPQGADSNVEGLQHCSYQETCPNCAATFVCTIVNPGIIQQVQ